MLAIILFLFPVLMPIDEFQIEIDEIGYFLIAPIEVLGLYGFIFSRRFGDSGVWKIAFLTSLGIGLFSLYEFWNTDLSEVKEFVSRGILFVLGTSLYVLTLPLWIALYRYGWHERHIWVAETENTSA